MARKYNKQGGFVGTKLRFDDYSGEANLRIHYRDLRKIFTAAALHLYDDMAKVRDSKRREDVERMTYNQGLLAHIRGIEAMADEQHRYVGQKVDPLTVKRTVEQRWAAVEAARKERKLFDDIFKQLRAESAKRPKKAKK